MYDTLRTFSCIIRVFYFFCIAFLLFICVRLTRDLINATYLLTYLDNSGGVQRLLVAEMVFGPHSGSLAMLQFNRTLQFFICRPLYS